MAQMAIRPPQFWINPLGSLAEEYSVYIGKPNEDATQPSSQITLMDGLSGAAIAQPFIITNGIARNTQGQQVLPTITATRYSIKFVDNDGVEVYAEEDFFSDAFGLDQEAALTADRILDSLADALVTDLTDLNYIFCKSENSGWEASLPGPDLNTYFFYTGIADPSRAGTKDTDPITGDFEGTFYDSVGNQWKIVPQPYVNATGLIDQSIDGRKTFLSNVIIANDKYFYIQGTNGDIEGPNAIRFKVKSDGSYEMDQKSSDGLTWVSIEAVLSTGQKVSRAPKNTFVQGLEIFNSKVITFRNNLSDSVGAGAWRLFNDSDNLLKLKSYNQSDLLFDRLVVGNLFTFSDRNGNRIGQLNVNDTALNDDFTIVTRKKGDARYITKGELVDFFLSGNTKSGVPSSWTVTYELISFETAKYTITHNLGKILRPMATYNSLGDTLQDAGTIPPYIQSTSSNTFTIITKSSISGSSGFSSLNVLVKI